MLKLVISAMLNRQIISAANTLSLRRQMDNSRPKIHVLVDSRESSVSFARSYYLQVSASYSLGIVEHIRGTSFASRLKVLLAKSSKDDVILLSFHYLSRDNLQQATAILQEKKHASKRIRFASYACFKHMKLWSDEVGIEFLANDMKKREKPKAASDRHALMTSEAMYRIWVQYRLMLAIISRIGSLGDVCKQLIEGVPNDGDTLEKEYNRALRFFEQGEPDMAGGSYSCEESGIFNPIDELRARLTKIAATDFNVLIKGDSGTGKETVAWAIHELSVRRDNAFIVLNCAGLPDDLLESELFGYQKGSHSQAYKDSGGILAIADGGTLFLDELPEMSPRIQAKLLRFMESGEYRPLGCPENKYSNMRIIAAGQPARLNDSSVRGDLKSRVGQLDIDLLPLRQLEKRSPGTLYKIAFILLERYTWSTIFNENQIRELTPYDIKQIQDKLASNLTLDLLISQEWKESNIRELNNFLRKWIVFGDSELNALAPGKTVKRAVQPDNEITFYDQQLESLLQEPKNRDELKDLVAQNPLQNLKKSYIRHLYAIYSAIIEYENTNLDMPKKPTQKELAKIMGVTENTISRHLN